ncbi:MAG: DUF2635 domain-containing protein [Alphaproteobacteria bacterium]|nr:DUF2635 domain-containing protein [Alphaproteobacteria bacterium]
MDNVLNIKPKDGLTVRDPDSMVALPPEGQIVPRNDYWLRRLEQGDVDLIDDAKSTPTKTPATKSPAAANNGDTATVKGS